MLVLSIETSCDETALSLFEVDNSSSQVKFKILSNEVFSQIDIHREYGGVFPNLAKREHARRIIPMFKKILEENDLLVENKNEIDEIKLREMLHFETDMIEPAQDLLRNYANPKIDLVCVTNGPGLAPALWVGVNFANIISEFWDSVALPVNHMEGHIWGSLVPNAKEFVLDKIDFPALALLVSGGHTELVLIRDNFKYEKIGQTLDDAVGESFDKVARILGLPYPGGPEISRLAEEARAEGLESKIKFPRPMLNTQDYDFSYSGLKTSVLYKSKDLTLDDKTKKEIALEFENSAIEVLVHKTKKAIENYGAQTLIVGGGVANNIHLKREIEKNCANLTNKILFPIRDCATDNSIMIGVVGVVNFLNQKINYTKTKSAPNESGRISADANLSL